MNIGQEQLLYIQNIYAHIIICIIQIIYTAIIYHQFHQFLCDILKNPNIYEFVFSSYLHF